MKLTLEQRRVLQHGIARAKRRHAMFRDMDVHVSTFDGETATFVPVGRDEHRRRHGD